MAPVNDEQRKTSGLCPSRGEISADLAESCRCRGQFFGIHASNDGKVMIFAGGIPLKRDGKIVGAIGVSGGSGEQDQAVAEAGVAAFK